MKISIITVNLNNATGLKETTESVFSQSYTDFEYIIIDGKSEDGSKEYLENISEKLAYYQSEKDAGIYDAMNIGIKKANGEHLFFLNSGDTFYNSDVLKNIETKLTEDIVYGDMQILDNHNRYINHTPDYLSFGFFVNNGIPHQAAFIRKILFNEVGLYNTNLKICADWAFFLDAIFIYNASYSRISTPISSFKTNGISSYIENEQIIAEERANHLRTNYMAFLKDFKKNEPMISKYEALKNSRIRKGLSFFFKQLKF